MLRFLAIFSLLIHPISAWAQSAQTSDIKVVELFTSKGCPACPKADRAFNGLIAQNNNVIGLSCHVTYFNGKTKHDALSQKFCNARQGVYKLALNTGGVYTPMMVINGKTVTTGLKTAERDAALNKNTQKISPINLIKSGQYIDITLPRIALEQPVDLWLFEIQIQGTQSGYEHYQNSVSNITKLLEWDGRPHEMAFPISGQSNKSYAVIAQTYKGGIIAAGQTR